jgi:2,3-bisphosphoglycerate-dependent phosphoglycerate mutase
VTEYPQARFTPPPGATDVLLVRHGQSAPARPEEPFPLLDGQGDPPLSPLGREQAAAVGRRLAGAGLDAVYVTTLRRTRETAQPLLDATGLEARVEPDLREVHLGEWEGGLFRRHVAEGHPLARRMRDEERWDVIPGAEAMEAFALRVRAGLQAVVMAAGPDVSVAAVVHGGVIGEACRQATDSRPFAFVHADNGSLTRLVVVPGGPWLLRSFNDTAHLA